MPLNDEKPGSTSSGGEDQSDVESFSERSNSVTSASDLDCSSGSFGSNNSSKQSTPSSSPPVVLTLDEVMDSARDLSNLSLAHEIIVNPKFHFEAKSPPKDSLYRLVKDNIHKAFWDILEAELNDDPPEYGQAIKLLEEIRETMLSFLHPGARANRMSSQIMEVLDIDLIRQQADNDVIDIQGLATYIINMMGKLCAPSRDEEIKKLRENTANIVTLFREIFRVLDLMKADMINVKIDIIRPVLLKEGIEYERAKFQSILDKTPKGLDNTTQWIKGAINELQSVFSSSEGKQSAVPGPFQVLNTAFLHVLTWDYSKNTLPEQPLSLSETRTFYRHFRAPWTTPPQRYSRPCRVWNPRLDPTCRLPPAPCSNKDHVDETSPPSYSSLSSSHLHLHPPLSIKHILYAPPK
ncbi:unnamed protein product [Knipowitschia caucasica]